MSHANVRTMSVQSIARTDRLLEAINAALAEGDFKLAADLMDLLHNAARQERK